jgi:hypothetical protein
MRNVWSKFGSFVGLGRMLTLSARFLGFYQNIGSVLYPVLSDIPALERRTKRLLENRRRVGGVYKANTDGLVKPFGMDLPFLSLLFAVLASGCQLSDFPESDRELTSWVYGASYSMKIAWGTVLTFLQFLVRINVFGC